MVNGTKTGSDLAVFALAANSFASRFHGARPFTIHRIPGIVNQSFSGS